MKKNKKIEINVIATMSAGKSTLINALIGQKLMPSKNDACTATITKVRNRNIKNYLGIAYDVDEEIVSLHPKMNIKTMEKLNESNQVLTIEVEGRIPWVDENTVLIDTPGPNNSRDINHKNLTETVLSNKKTHFIIYILNATQLGVNDDKTLLKFTVEKLKKESEFHEKRIIFALNKLDLFRSEENSVEESIGRAYEYLKENGLENPVICPISAIGALEIQTYLKGVKDVGSIILNSDSEVEAVEAAMRVKKLNRNKEFHLEMYGECEELKKIIKDKLKKARNDRDESMEGLIHTGIFNLEYRIKEFIKNKGEKDILKIDAINKEKSVDKNIESFNFFSVRK